MEIGAAAVVSFKYFQSCVLSRAIVHAGATVNYTIPAAGSARRIICPLFRYRAAPRNDCASRNYRRLTAEHLKLITSINCYKNC